MASQFGSRSIGKRVRLRDEFVDGLRCFHSSDYEGAVLLFRAADEQADMNDIYQNRYTSFHGLTRVCMGDRSGVKLCRKAAVGEVSDAEVYYNLAMAEHRLGFRESTYTALRRGLNVDPGHTGLLRLKQQLVLREKHRFITALKRGNVINGLLGKFFRGSRRARTR